ncbi:MAG: hydroxymethylglutaryl-CoA synthase [Verrucomicrobia bacterium]|nr:MAG: hydroxymethylglutaryl-CoA synthase [Verrucomicrobiota bacterium]
MNVGIDLISFQTSQYFLDLATLAQVRGVEAEKYRAGLGQERMAVPPPDEDIVTLAASAAKPIMEKINSNDIELLLFGTESGVDQSKAAALFVHGLLNLSKRCRAVEIKEACYAATAGLQLALAWVQQHPDKKALVLGADIARYDLGSPGEPTQGCGAIALLISANPRLLVLDPETGFHAENVMDFWRPNYRTEALVDGKYSTLVYLSTLVDSWRQYRVATGRKLGDLARSCFHLPFTRLAEKAYVRLCREEKIPEPPPDEIQRKIGPSLLYNRQTGNTYAASLYESVAALLDNDPEDLSGQRISLFSYGSGCMAEFFSGVVQPGYREHLFAERHRRMLAERTELTYRQYEDVFRYHVPADGGDHVFAPYRTGLYRLQGIKQHVRLYAATT